MRAARELGPWSVTIAASATHNILMKRKRKERTRAGHLEHKPPSTDVPEHVGLGLTNQSTRPAANGQINLASTHIIETDPKSVTDLSLV